MKLLHVIATLNPAGGGPAETLRQFTPALLALGHELTTVTLDPEDAPWLSSFPGTIVALGPSRPNYHYTRRLRPWLEENKDRFDAIIVRGLWQYHGFAVRRVLRNSSTPYFVFTHGMLDPWFKRRYPLKHLKKWLYWPFGEYLVLRDAAAVLFTSEEERRVSRESFWLYRCNEKVVSYGTSMPPPADQKQKQAFVEAFPETAGKRLILFLSRIHPKKGCDILIDAFASVASSDPRLHLVMAGPDQIGMRPALEAAAIKAGIGERITWTGMLTGDLKWGAYRSVEAFILPSHQENFGIVVAEALACGIPVLISNKVNIWREILSAKAGLVADDTLDGTKQLLNDWLSLSSDERTEYQSRATAIFLERFEISEAARSLTAIITQAIAGGHSK